MYIKRNYKRQFPENHSTDCIVYVESQDFGEKLGNKNPITTTKLFTEQVKGIVGIHRINAYKIGITFKKPAPANNFLNMDLFLGRHKLKAFVPAILAESTGVLRYIPKELSNEEIYKNIACDAEVISIKRFMRKVEGKLVPLGTVSVTFASTILPQYVYLNMYRYKVNQYIPPLIQCFKCLKFNHSARVCRGEQMCSSCAGQHSYKECDVEEITCINCGGNHLAISRDCPIKKQKIEEKKKKYTKPSQSYATVVSTPPISPIVTPTTFPAITKTVNRGPLNAQQIVENDIIISAIIKSLVTLGNSKDNSPITNKKIKDILLANLIS